MQSNYLYQIMEFSDLKYDERLAKVGLIETIYCSIHDIYSF